MQSPHGAPTVRPMDDAARESAVDHLVRDSDAVRDSVEIVRQRRAGDRVTALARWIETRTGRLRRGAVDVVMTDGGVAGSRRMEFQRQPRLRQPGLGCLGWQFTFD